MGFNVFIYLLFGSILTWVENIKCENKHNITFTDNNITFTDNNTTFTDNNTLNEDIMKFDEGSTLGERKDEIEFRSIGDQNEMISLASDSAYIENEFAKKNYRSLVGYRNLDKEVSTKRPTSGTCNNGCWG